MSSACAMDFDTHGQWNASRARGPAIHAPTQVRAIILGIDFRVEFLNVSHPNYNFFSKNHLVTTASFIQPIQIGNTLYKSARISMQLGPCMEVVAGPGYEPGSSYIPGVLTVKLLTYREPAHRSLQHRTFRLKDGVTLGEVLDSAITKNMHHFLFLPYTVEGRWKGCGDFTLQFWGVLVRAGIIVSEKSEENPDSDLSTDLTITYAPGALQTQELIGRGWWIMWNPEDDMCTPETVYSDSRPTYMLS